MLGTSCSSKSDYYYLGGMSREGDTVLLHFLYTCGRIDVTWNGAFIGAQVGPASYISASAELSIYHDDLGRTCPEDLKKVPFDVGPMKQEFRVDHPTPEPLELRAPPYEPEHGAYCLSDLFWGGSVDGNLCK